MASCSNVRSSADIFMGGNPMSDILVKLKVEYSEKDGKWTATALQCQGAGETKPLALASLKRVIHYPPKRTVMEQVILEESR